MDTKLASKSTLEAHPVHWYLVTPDHGASMRISDGMLLEMDEFGELIAASRHSDKGVIRFHLDGGAIWIYVCHAEWCLSANGTPVPGPFETRVSARLRLGNWTAFLATDISEPPGEGPLDLVLERKVASMRTSPLRFVLVEDPVEDSVKESADASVSDSPGSVAAANQSERRGQAPDQEVLEGNLPVEIGRPAEAVIPADENATLRVMVRRKAALDDAEILNWDVDDEDIPLLVDKFAAGDSDIVHGVHGSAEADLDLDLVLPEPEVIAEDKPPSSSASPFAVQPELWQTEPPSYTRSNPVVRPGSRYGRSSTSAESRIELLPPRKTASLLAGMLLSMGLLMSLQAQSPIIALTPELIAKRAAQEQSADRLLQATDELVKTKPSLDPATREFAVAAYEAAGREDRLPSSLEQVVPEVEAARTLQPNIAPRDVR